MVLIGWSGDNLHLQLFGFLVQERTVLCSGGGGGGGGGSYFENLYITILIKCFMDIQLKHVTFRYRIVPTFRV